jgi:hypothetical protein
MGVVMVIGKYLGVDLLYTISLFGVVGIGNRKPNIGYWYRHTKICLKKAL